MSKQVEKLLATARKHESGTHVARAVEAYKELSTLEPKNLRHRLKMAELLVKAGRLEAANMAFQALGQIYLQQRMLVQAAAVFKRSLKLEPDSIALRFTLADVYLSMEHHADAVQQLLVALELKEDLAEQVEVLTRIVVIDPENLPYRLRLAETHKTLGNEHQALSAFGYVLTELLRLEDVTTATSVLEQLAEIDADGEEVRGIVRTLIDGGEPGSAEWLITAHLREHPTDLAAMDLLSQVLGNTGRGAETFTILLEKSAISQTSSEHAISPAFQNMITRDVTFGRPDIRTDMNATVEMNFMASTMELDFKEQAALLGQPVEGEIVKVELEEISVSSVDLHLLEAAACVRLGLRDRAEEHLKLVMEEDPDNERAFELLESLY